MLCLYLRSYNSFRRKLCITVIIFLDTPGNVSIYPYQISYRIGDELICSADGNPEPSYQWKNLRNGKISSGPVLAVVTSLDMQQECQFLCIASNNVGNSTLSITFVILSISGTNKYIYLCTIINLFTFCRVQFLVILLLLLFFNYYYCICFSLRAREYKACRLKIVT